MQTGDYVKYKNTGTVGKVVEVRTEEGVEWITLDNKLVYHSAYLEPASVEEYRTTSVKERTQGLSIEEIEKLKDDLMKAERHAYVTGGGGG
jgi:hypothetical protein